jgi:hypothetical protein
MTMRPILIAALLMAAAAALADADQRYAQLPRTPMTAPTMVPTPMNATPGAHRGVPDTGGGALEPERGAPPIGEGR